MTLSAVALLAVTAGTRCALLVDLGRALEAGADVEAAAAVQRSHVVSALSSLMFALFTEQLPDDVQRTADVLMVDLVTSVPMLGAGLLGIDRVRKIGAACEMLAAVCRWENEAAGVERVAE